MRRTRGQTPKATGESPLGQPWLDLDRRLLVLKWALCAALLSEMALCPNLWGFSRSFPTIPAFRWIPDLPPTATPVFSLLLVGSIVFVAIGKCSGPVAFTVPIFGLILALFDINRLQPWFYQVLLLFLALGSKPSRSAMAAWGIVLSGTYFWSGLQKTNLVFAHKVFPWLLQPFGLEALRPLWFCAPLAEVAIGILLLFPRTRTAAIIAAIAMHALLLIALGPLGQNANSVVWPWNVWMPTLTFLTFFRNPEPILPRAWQSPAGIAAVLLAGLLPALSLWDKWDDNLSASLYSGRTRQAFILLTKQAAQRLPREVRPYVELKPDRIGLDITRWAMSDLNVPPYPETRTYQSIATKLVSNGVPREGMTLVVTGRPTLGGTSGSFQVVPIP